MRFFILQRCMAIIVNVIGSKISLTTKVYIFFVKNRSMKLAKFDAEQKMSERILDN